MCFLCGRKSRPQTKVEEMLRKNPNGKEEYNNDYMKYQSIPTSWIGRNLK